MQLLKNINGTVSPGELVAVFGPSGSGKTTLLDILANRKESGDITGTVLINGEPFDEEYKRLCSYVVQEDILLPTITVRETLRFYADLKLPSSWTNREKEERIQSVLEQIGLTHRADMKIGGMLPGGIHVRGLSGGEKRRVTIGCGLVTSPSIMLLDEPTSGLDTTSAMAVMKTLVELTQDKNVTVICTIHQPRSEIYRLFTKVLVLSEGRLVYYGSDPVNHFVDLGYPFPEQTNPADYILDAVTQIKENGRANEVGDRLADSYSAQVAEVNARLGADVGASRGPKKYSSAYNNGLFTQFLVLWKRTGRDFLRNPSNSIIRFVVAAFVGLLFGACFANLSYTAKGMQSRAAVLFYLVINMVLQPFCSISLFISKRTLFNAERAARLYHTLPYYLAMMFFECLACIITAFILGTIAYWFADLNNGVDNYFFAMAILVLAHFAGDFFMLFISCLTIQVDSSFAIGAGVTTVYQLFAGFFVTIDSLPKSFGWLRYINFIYYSFQAMMANEFENTKMDCGLPQCPTGKDFLEQFGMEDARKGIDLVIVSAFAIAFFGLRKYTTGGGTFQIAQFPISVPAYIQGQSYYVTAYSGCTL
ncbi:ABC transporter G family protein [Heterostelium album PN500]|uniref:ABC transporter G family protein n=1 Tax=Heterostelium pallidum (strain ATCC 26659 / Pp 5 / PN500) TaxID=670386 RepID=D3BC23_HETP5|nr:ABC transporter G family protein [Heterostelium album PN500]EFA81206.1 ABC transporter G family protein [Heterostelium album PN500]|eukprot:XP_020433324.1 ABC transporter G family protein [Heterostelium album PN500]